jgi:RIO kinase 1
MIDLPQVVDVIANPQGAAYLDRDAANVAAWFTARGLAGASTAPDELGALLRYEARLD